jgi:hypothetical protein
VLAVNEPRRHVPSLVDQPTVTQAAAACKNQSHRAARERTLLSFAGWTRGVARERRFALEAS